MTKVDFLKKWSKSAAGGSATEGFERDVEVLIRSVVRMSASGVVNGLLAGLEGAPKKLNRDQMRKIIQEISPAVEQALRKLYE